MAAGQDAGTADGELEALAAHLLDQHAELEFAAARDLERLGLVAVGHLDGDVALGLPEQAVADLAGGDLLAFAAGQRAVVDAEGHRQGRRIDRDGGERGGQFRGADGVGDGGLAEAGDGDDVAGFRLLHRHAIQAAERQQLGHPAGLAGGAVGVKDLHRSC